MPARESGPADPRAAAERLQTARTIAWYEGEAKHVREATRDHDVSRNDRPDLPPAPAALARHRLAGHLKPLPPPPRSGHIPTA